MINNQWQALLQAFGDYYFYFLDRLPGLFVGVCFLILFHFSAKLLLRLIRKGLALRLDDGLVLSFILKCIRIVLYGIAILIFLRIIGFGRLAFGLWGTAGIGAFIIGFAFKDIGEHFLAGFILAFKRPFRVGDVIEINGYTGTVLELDLRDTHIKTFDGKDVYIPNGTLIKNVLQNYTLDGFIRNNFSLDMQVNDQLDQAMSLIQKLLEAHPDVIQEGKAPFVTIDSVTNGRAILSVFYWLDLTQSEVSSTDIKRTLTLNSIHALLENGFALDRSVIL